MYELNAAAITIGKLCFEAISSPTSHNDEGHFGENLDLSRIPLARREAIVRWGIVLPRGAGGSYRLLHKSLAEFFAAKFMAGHRGRLADLSLVSGKGNHRRFRSELRLTLLFLALLAPDRSLLRRIVSKVVDTVTALFQRQSRIANNQDEWTDDDAAIDIVVNLDAVAGTDIFCRLPRPRYEKFADWLAAATGRDRDGSKQQVPGFYRQCLRFCGRHNALSTLKFVIEWVPEAKDRWTSDLQDASSMLSNTTATATAVPSQFFSPRSSRCHWTSMSRSR